MSDILLDGRGEDELRAEMLARAAAVFADRADAIEPGEVLHALFGVAARIGEEVTRRLDQVPAKQAANFYTAMGLGRAPPIPARMPVAFTLANSAPAGLPAPVGTKLQAAAGRAPVTFETLSQLDLARGKLAQLYAADLAQDRIHIAPGPVLAPALPRPEPTLRRLIGGAGAGAAVLQIEPPSGLAAGMVLRIGDPTAEDDHIATKVEGNLVTIDPPLGSTMADGSPVREVTMFAPWGPGTRDHQSHALYLGHATLLDVPSQTIILVSGVAAEQPIVWSWFGKLNEPDAPAWQAFTAQTLDNQGRWRLEKPAGKPEKTTIEGRNGLWLRAMLSDGASSGVQSAQTIRIAIGDCDAAALTCPATDASVMFEAVAVNTPAVITRPFHPFGREPRIYDAFHVGCNEAFGKAGAAVRMCFTLGGASLGPMAVVESSTVQQVFAIGTDGLLYRARLEGSAPGFSRLPLPPELAETGFESQAPVAARLVGPLIQITVGAPGGVYTAAFIAETAPAEGTLAWNRLTGDDESNDIMVSAIYQIGDTLNAQMALCGEKLFTWTGADSSLQLAVDNETIDLIRIENQPGTHAAQVKINAAGETEIWLWEGADALPQLIARDVEASLPETMRAAWIGADRAVYIAGYDAPGDDPDAPRALTMARYKTGERPRVAPPLGVFAPLPIGFSPPLGDDDNNDWPVIVLATQVPTRIAVIDDEVRQIFGDPAIGSSANRERRYIETDALTLIQHPDQGLYYRARVPAAYAAYALNGNYVPGIRTGLLPPDTAWMVLEDAEDGAAYRAALHSVTRDTLLQAASDTARPSPGPDPLPTKLLPLRLASGAEMSVTLDDGTELTLTAGYEAAALELYLLEDAAEAHIWLLSRTDEADDWTIPPNFAPQTGATYAALEAMTGAEGELFKLDLSAANINGYFSAPATEVASLRNAGATRPLFEARGTAQLGQSATSNGTAIFPFTGPLLENRTLDAATISLTMQPGTWSAVGPDQPANPDLSWEYWNGSNWWTLDAKGLRDTTANLLVEGGVFFTVPPDLAETDVGGRQNRWIRARLIGGDYGQARVTVSTTGPADNSTQTVTRDLSAIRAPYIISLNLTYCAPTALAPETVLTFDNLGAVDQTNANFADLPVRLFPPVSTLFDPALPDAPERAGGEGPCCEQWDDLPPPPAPAAQPPKRSTGTSCLSWHDPATSGAAPAMQRALLLGFDQPLQGDAVSLYVDAEPSGNVTPINAFAFRAGAFMPIGVLGDTSSGLCESGVLLLGLPQAPDLASHFGQAGYWIALAPAQPAADWSPQVRAIYLNGTMAAAVETRANESLGASTGAPDQTFRLVAAPVDPDSLDLRIAEPLGAEDAKRLGADEEIEGMPGPWVRWQQLNELPGSQALYPARVYTLDALSGEIRFGNGSNALVPPMGSAVLARGYRKVVGADANGVLAGAVLQTVSPIAGIDKVSALDTARGGVDAETTDRSLARAPTKLTNGDRLVTLDDIAEYARHRLPGVAQAAASNRRGGVRLVVAGRGSKLIPTPSELLGVAENIAAVATYGIGTKLEVVKPRLLPISIAVTLLADRTADLAALLAAVRGTIARFFDHETGGYDEAGWPIGAMPGQSDVAAALAAVPLEGLLTGVTITRADSKPLPQPLPADVLVRIAAIEPSVEQAA